MSITTKMGGRGATKLGPSTEARNVKVVLTDTISLGEYGRSEDGTRYQQIRFPFAGKIIERMVPLASLAPRCPVFQDLINAGAPLIAMAAQNELINRLQACEPGQATLTVATRTGFCGRTFVFPRRKIGPNSTRIRVCLPAGRSERITRYRVKGTLAGWQRIAKLAVGNTRFMLVVAVALGGAIAALLRQRPISILLVGPPEIGKTTELIAAGSVFGCHVDPMMATSLGFAQSE